MSQPNKKQKNKKRDDSSRSKQANQSSATPPTNESTIENDDTNASNSVSLPSLIDEEKLQLQLDLTIQNQQEFLINKYLCENRLERDNAQNYACEKVVQTAIPKFQAEVKECLKDLSNLPSIRNDFAKMVADIKEKIQSCDTYTDELKEDYSTMINFVTEKMNNIGRVNGALNEMIQKTIDQQKFFDRESQLEEQRLDKVNREIEIVLKQRDDMALRISEANKVISKMTKATTKLEKTKKRLKHQIEKKEREKAVNDEAIAVMNDNVRKCINEKTETIKKLDEEEIQLQTEQANLMAALDNSKEKYTNLCQEEEELMEKTAEQEKKIVRVKVANKNLRHDETPNLEFEQRFGLLSVELKKIEDENVEIQHSVDEKQQQWDNLKRVQDIFLKKQQVHNELQLKLAALKEENAASSTKLSNTKKNVNNAKLRENNKGMAAVLIAKRMRLSSNTTVDDPEPLEVVSNSSSIHMSDLEDFELDSVFDCMDSFNQI